MSSLNKLRALAGISIDLSKVENAKTSVRAPANSAPILEHTKVPQHRGELAPKTKDNMKARVNNAKKALEALELAREALMEIPAVDYMEDIPTIIKQLHHMLHGDDGTGGVHHLHRHYKNQFDSTVFPEDIEEERRKEEEEQQKADAGITGDEEDTSKKKKKTNEGVLAMVGFEKQKVDPSKENKKPFKLADGSLPNEDTMIMDKKQAKEVAEDPKDNTPVDDKVNEANFGLGTKGGAGRRSKLTATSGEDESGDDEINPKAKEAAKGVAKTELAKNPFSEEEEKADEEDCADSMPVAEASGPLFARDGMHPKHGAEAVYPSWADGTKPVNVVSDETPSIYYPNGSKRENANQLSTNPYNENQKVSVPAKIKTALKTEADTARKLAETFEMRKDWDSKNFHETMANAFDTLVGFLDKGTIYGIKEAQIFMTSLMSPFTNKLPAEVVKYIAAGGTLRSLKSYVNDVKEPVTGTVFSQDSDGTK